MWDRRLIWETSPGGLLLPTGSVEDTTECSTHSYASVVSRIKEFDKLVSSCGLTIASNTNLTRMITNAKLLSELWLANRVDELHPQMLFDTHHLLRFLDAVLPLKTNPKCQTYLKAMLSGALDFFDRRRSQAKDIFWELEIWSTLYRAGIESELLDPPDVIAKLNGRVIGIACKKLYSEGHVQNVLSEAVSQVEAAFDLSIVAINIDDLTPINSVLKTRGVQDVELLLSEFNQKFLHRHHRHFTKYLSADRLSCVLVGVNVIVHVLNARPPIQIAKWWTEWTVPEISSEKRNILKQLARNLA